MYLDGYPVILFDKDQHGTELLDVGEDQHTSLAIMLGSLVEHGLVSYDHFQLESDQPVVGNSKSHKFVLRHKVDQQSGQLPFIQFTGHHCTDLGLDLARLCERPRLNAISDKSYEELCQNLAGQSELVLECLDTDGEYVHQPCAPEAL